MLKNKQPTHYFYINGYKFKVLNDSNSESEINIDKVKMFVSNKNYGYTDINWKNFTGETLTLTILSRTTEVYTGEHTQPDDGGGIDTFYNYARTPHAVLKYWAQNFVPFNIKTNLQAHESARYVVDEGGFSQENPKQNVVLTHLTLIQYEKPYEMEQTYWQNETKNNTNTVHLSAISREIEDLPSNLKQTCFCTVNTPKSNCTAHTDSNVEIVQKYLSQWGYFNRFTYNLDGKYCYTTTQAVKKFQEDYGLTITGKFNTETKNAFMKKLKE